MMLVHHPVSTWPPQPRTSSSWALLAAQEAAYKAPTRDHSNAGYLHQRNTTYV